MSYRLADHLVTPRIGYTHHGLYAGGGEVLEYSQKGVHLVSLSNFSEGNDIRIEEHSVRFYSREESIQRGISRLGEDEYNVVFNNCERFVYWCIDGLPVCSQIEGRILKAIELAARVYIETHRLPPGTVEFLTKNPIMAQKLFSLFGGNKPIFDVLGPAMSSAHIPYLSTTLITPIVGTAASTIATSTVAGVIGGTVAGVGTGVVAGSTITAGAATVAGAIGGGVATAGAIAAAPVVAGVGAAVAVGYGIKKIFDFFSD